MAFFLRVLFFLLLAGFVVGDIFFFSIFGGDYEYFRENSKTQAGIQI